MPMHIGPVGRVCLYPSSDIREVIKTFNRGLYDKFCVLESSFY